VTNPSVLSQASQ
jgi:hypothetical protein